MGFFDPDREIKRDSGRNRCECPKDGEELSNLFSAASQWPCTEGALNTNRHGVRTARCHRLKCTSSASIDEIGREKTKGEGKEGGKVMGSQINRICGAKPMLCMARAIDQAFKALAFPFTVYNLPIASFLRGGEGDSRDVIALRSSCCITEGRGR